MTDMAAKDLAHRSTRRPIPIEVVLRISTLLARDKVLGTLASITALSRETYELVTPVLYDRVVLRAKGSHFLSRLEDIPPEEMHWFFSADDKESAIRTHSFDQPLTVRIRKSFAAVRTLVFEAAFKPTEFERLDQMAQLDKAIHGRLLFSALRGCSFSAKVAGAAVDGANKKIQWRFAALLRDYANSPGICLRYTSVDRLVKREDQEDALWCCFTLVDSPNKVRRTLDVHHLPHHCPAVRVATVRASLAPVRFFDGDMREPTHKFFRAWAENVYDLVKDGFDLDEADLPSLADTIDKPSKTARVVAWRPLDWAFSGVDFAASSSKLTARANVAEVRQRFMEEGRNFFEGLVRRQRLDDADRELLWNATWGGVKFLEEDEARLVCEVCGGA